MRSKSIQFDQPPLSSIVNHCHSCKKSNQIHLTRLKGASNKDESSGEFVFVFAAKCVSKFPARTRSFSLYAVGGGVCAV